MRLSWLASPPRRGDGGLWRRRLPAQLAGRDRGGRPKRDVPEGQQAGGLRPLAARFFPEPDAHCRDEGSPLAAPVFRQEERHVTFW